MMLDPATERRALQIAILIAGLVPVGAGLSGVLSGGSFVGADNLDISADSHMRYLSGLLLGIGLAFWAAVPTIERQTARARLLTAIVFIGGLARLIGLRNGFPEGSMIFALAMELIVTPALCLWQTRVARRFNSP